MDFPSQQDLEFRGSSEARALAGRFLDRPNHGRRRMAQDHWSPGQYVVDVRISIQVVELGAFGSVNKAGLPTHGAKGPDWAIDSAWYKSLSFFEQLDRSGDFHDGRAPYHASSERSRKRLYRQLDADCHTLGQKVFKWIRYFTDLIQFLSSEQN